MPYYRLFHSPGACSFAPHILLEELGVPYEPVRVVIADGDNRRPEYLAINPRGRVPALAIRADRDHAGNERILTEASAIMIYLARTHPDAQLLPTDTEGFVRAVEWMSWLSFTMHSSGIRTIIRPDRFSADDACKDSIAARGRENVVAGFADIEARLSGRAWALGERFTAVDAYLLVFFRWGNKVGLPMRVHYPNYTRIMDAVRARPAVRRAIEQEGIQIE